MNIDLSKRSAIVTGSTAGIGLAIANAPAAAGASVGVTGRTPARADSALAGIRKDVPEAQLSGVAGGLATAEGALVLPQAVPRRSEGPVITSTGRFMKMRFLILTVTVC